MKFRSLTIEKEYSIKGGWFKGRIGSDTNNGDWITLNLDDEFTKKVVMNCLPLFERALSEKIDFIKEEIKSFRNKPIIREKEILALKDTYELIK